MSNLTRRRVLQSGAALAGGSLLTAISPDLVRGAAEALVLGQQRLDLSATRVVGEFAAGSGSQQLGIWDFPGVEPEGPNAVAAMRDGSVAILDTVNRRVAIVRGSRVQRTVGIPQAIYARDILEVGGHLFVLDRSGDQILRVDSSATVVGALVPHSGNAATFLLDAGGTLGVVEQDAMSYRIAAGRASMAPGFITASGQGLHVDYERAQLRRFATAHIGPTAVPMQTRSILASVTPAGTDDSGRTYLLTAELIQGAVGLDVDLVVHRVESDGYVSGQARVPVRGRWFNPARSVSISPTGQAIAIVPLKTRTLLLELEWQPQVAPLAAALVIPQGAFEALATNTIGVCRSTAISIANDYHSHSWYCTLSNYNQCSQNGYTSQRPSYITGYNRYYATIPYNWGGWKTMSQFDTDMSNSKTAGNTSPNAVLTCSSGVDCSGYVQQCWGITNQKYNDSGLTAWCFGGSSVDTVNGPTGMQSGDYYQLPGSHARLHDSYGLYNASAWVYESVGSPGCVQYVNYSWSSFSGYKYWFGNFGSPCI